MILYLSIYIFFRTIYYCDESADFDVKSLASHDKLVKLYKKKYFILFIYLIFTLYNLY